MRGFFSRGTKDSPSDSASPSPRSYPSTSPASVPLEMEMQTVCAQTQRMVSVICLHLLNQRRLFRSFLSNRLRCSCCSIAAKSSEDYVYMFQGFWQREGCAGGFWNKLSVADTKEILSLKSMLLEDVHGTSVESGLMSLIEKPGYNALPHYYLRAGSELLEEKAIGRGILPLLQRATLVQTFGQRNHVCLKEGSIEPLSVNSRMEMD